jgi:hypothetical protein
VTPSTCPNRCRAALLVLDCCSRPYQQPLASCSPTPSVPTGPLTAAQSELAERLAFSIAEPGRWCFVLEICTSFPTATCIFDSKPASFRLMRFAADSLRRSSSSPASLAKRRHSSRYHDRRLHKSIINCSTKPRSPVNSSSHFTVKSTCAPRRSENKPHHPRSHVLAQPSTVLPHPI